MSQIILDSNSDTLTGSAGAVSLATSNTYHLASAKTSAAAGQSFLRALKTALDSATGVTFTVALSAAFKVTVIQSSGGSKTITWTDTNLRDILGFTGATTVCASATLVTADNLSPHFWSPGIPISDVGPRQFDPAVSYGVPSSAGSAHRSSDMTSAFTRNGVQYEATYVFTGIEYAYRMRATSGYTNQDLETWWTYGPSKGRKILMWRNRDNCTGSDAPSAGSATPYKCIEYYPNETLRAEMPGVPIAPPNLYYWDASLGFWVTENGETPPT